MKDSPLNRRQMPWTKVFFTTLDQKNNQLQNTAMVATTSASLADKLKPESSQVGAGRSLNVHFLKYGIEFVSS